LVTAWFDHWLRGAQNGITKMPKIQYYTVGSGRWSGAASWPVAQSRELRFYFGDPARGTGNAGGGRLSTSNQTETSQHRFRYDPANPTPSAGGPWSDEIVADLRPLAARKDVLVYTSDPLDGDLEITGNIDATLFVSSSAKDTDFVVKLGEVLPDGTTLVIQEGMLRARYREGWSRPVWMNPGKKYRVPVMLQATSIVVGKGSRLQVIVSSSSFPRWDRNLNMGGSNFKGTAMKVADNVVHVGGTESSYLTVSTVPR
jgi:putative CocE/NonD family hydrolase